MQYLKIVLHLLVTSCMTEINNTQTNDARDIDIVMPMQSSVEHSNACSQTSGSLWEYWRDKPAIDENGNITHFPANNNSSISFKFK